MRIAMYQMRGEGSVAGNLAKSLRAAEEAAGHGADLILFPEVQLTEFFPQYPGRDVSAYRVELNSEIVASFRDAAQKNRIMLVPNIYLYENGKSYDASLLIDKRGEILGVQKMVHVAQMPEFYEQDYYTPSDEGFKVFSTEYGKIGIVICFDRHYSESVRTEALRGADLVLIPTVNTKSEPMDMFEKELNVQAFQNSVAIAMCNRVGREGNMDFAGESIVVDADGNTVLKAGDEEVLVYADIDLAYSGKVRDSRPYTAFRRPELYE